jgi:hypothetical protein
VVIRNSRWIPGCGRPTQGYLLGASNDGQHDFGYPCHMPREIVVDGLEIDDRQTPKQYGGPYLFSDPDGRAPAEAKQPFPYRPTERVTLRRVTVASGKPLQVSPDAAFAAKVQVIDAK